MKTNIFITAILIVCFYSCSKTNVNTKITEYRVGPYITKIKVVEIDSCEYLWGDWGNATVLTHKGNCKHCAKRNAKK